MEREELIKVIERCMNDDMEPPCNDCKAEIDGLYIIANGAEGE